MPQLSPQQGVDGDNAIWPAYNADIVIECQQMFVRAQLLQSSVLPVRTKPALLGHLAPHFSLNDIMHNSHTPKCGWKWNCVEQGDKWEHRVPAFHGPQTFQH